MLKTHITKLYKIFITTIITLILTTFYANAKNVVLTVGASTTPHAEILAFVSPALEKKGIKLRVINFADYILPNKALASKDLDANYFQHIVYLDAQNKEYNYNFVVAGKIHIEPIGIYSNSVYKNITDVKNGATVIFSNSASDRGRALRLLEKAKLITLKAGADPINASLDDITANPKNLVIKNNVNPELLPRVYSNKQADLVIINTNYALGAGLNPSDDALVIEDSNSPYVNVIAVRSGDENKTEIKELVQALQSTETRNFIKSKWKGAIVTTK